MHDSEVEVQTIKGTREKKAAVGGEMDIEKLMEFNFDNEQDELKGQVIEAIKSNAKEVEMVAKVDEQLIYDLVGFGESKRNISVNDT